MPIQFKPRPRWFEVLLVVAVLVGLNLPSLMTTAQDLGTPAGALGWGLYLAIPLRWSLPLVASVGLAFGRVPLVLIAGFLGVAYAAANAYLYDQVTLETLAGLTAPAAYLSVMVAGVRLARRQLFSGRVVILSGLFLYIGAAAPAIRLYVDRVLDF